MFSGKMMGYLFILFGLQITSPLPSPLPIEKRLRWDSTRRLKQSVVVQPELRAMETHGFPAWIHRGFTKNRVQIAIVSYGKHDDNPLCRYGFWMVLDTLLAGQTDLRLFQCDFTRQSKISHSEHIQRILKLCFFQSMVVIAIVCFQFQNMTHSQVPQIPQ